MPVATTLKVAVAGAMTVMLLTGWLVMLGSTATLTVKLAVVLVTLPAVLVTTHSYKVPLLAAVVAGVVYEALVAPVIFVNVTPSLLDIHWYFGEGEPLATTLNVAVAGAMTVILLTGWVVMFGATGMAAA